MRSAILVATAALLGGCNYQPLDAYRDVRDKVEAATGLPLLGRGSCFRAIDDDKFGAGKSLTEICYKLTPQRRWHGLWRNDFEGSRFCAAPASSCSRDTPGDRTWLQYSFGLTDTKPREWKVPPGGLYEVEFVGRRTAIKGRYGHMGGSDYAMIVDRLISIREIEAPPKQEE
jgi:hypothetical protein